MTTLQTYARARRDFTKPLVLGQLVVPKADPAHGNTFKIADLTSRILVEVPKSVDMKNSDSIQLFHRQQDGTDSELGSPVELAGVDLEDPLITKFDLYIEVAEIPAKGTDIRMRLDYKVHDPVAQDGQFSNLPVTVRFDQVIPGGDLLPPIDFTDDQLSGITVDDLDQGVLPLKVDPYFGAEADDVVELWLGTSTDTGAYLTPTFTVTDPTLVLSVSITEAALKVDPDGPKYFGYRVTDWAGNRSELSNLVRVEVFLGLPTLTAPVVPEHADGLITFNDAADGVDVVIPPITGAAAGDLIYVLWGTATHAPYPLPNPVPTPPNPAATIPVPYDIVKQAGSGLARPVRYRWQRTGFPPVESPSIGINVDLRTPGGDPDPDPTKPELENIKAPEVRCGNSPVNTIRPEDYGKAATATLFRAGENNNVIWAIDDVIQMHWGTVSAPEMPAIPVTRTNEPANISAPVPFDDVIEAVGVGTVPVWFTLTRLLDGTNTVTVKSKIQNVSVVSSNNLPGDGNTLIAGRFPDANNSNVITRAVALAGTTFRISLKDVSNIELAKNPKVSYDFVGVASVDEPDYGGEAPIEESRVKADDVPITQTDLAREYVEVPLTYNGQLRFICRNGAILDYSLKNDSGRTPGLQQFVRVAANLGGGGCPVI